MCFGEILEAGKWQRQVDEQLFSGRSLFVLSEVYLLEVYLISGQDLHLTSLEVLLSVQLQRFPLFCYSLSITLYMCIDRAMRGDIFL